MDTAESSKGKVIAWITVIAAVVIVYLVMTARAHNTSANAIPAASGTGNTTSSPLTNAGPGSSNSGQGSTSPSSSSSYKDGTYTASENYDVPHDVEGLSVTLTVKGGSVDSVSIKQTASNRDSQEYQDLFASNYQPYVVGKKLSDLQLNRVSGASLTSEAFNEALARIASQAQA